MSSATLIATLVARQIDKMRVGDSPPHLNPVQATDWRDGWAAGRAGRQKPRWQTSLWKNGYADGKIARRHSRPS